MAEKRTVKFDDEGRAKLQVQSIEVSVTDGPDEGIVVRNEHWLEKSGGNGAKAAREAKMDRSHLFHSLLRYDLR